jgi:hypothetical protein
MATDIGKAMARLRHRDVRTRRRAVRTLFEHDDPATLEAFETLLDDEDAWFVSKALDAYRQWAPQVGPDAVRTLLEHRNLDVRRCGANLLSSVGAAGVELALSGLADDDRVVQKKSSQALLAHGGARGIEALLMHRSPSVRASAMHHHETPDEAILSGLADEAPSVQTVALEIMLKRDLETSLSTLLPFFEADVHPVPVLMWAARHAPNELERLAKRMKSGHLKALTDRLRAEISSSEDHLLQALINANMLTPVARWVMNQGQGEDALRWWLINNEELDLIERCKLLERLVGRAAEATVQKEVQSLLAKAPQELLKVACENLSTAATEVLS